MVIADVYGHFARLYGVKNKQECAKLLAFRCTDILALSYCYRSAQHRRRPKFTNSALTLVARRLTPSI